MTKTPGREALALATKHLRGIEYNSNGSIPPQPVVYIPAMPVAVRDFILSSLAANPSSDPDAMNERRVEEDARLAAKSADEGWTFAKLLSNALLKIRPLGGSELFVKRNGDYYADPEYCGRLIEEMQAALHKARVEKVRLEMSLSTTGEPKR